MQADPAQPSDVSRRAVAHNRCAAISTRSCSRPSRRRRKSDTRPSTPSLTISNAISRARPVLAQPDSLWYRVRKFVARNTLAVGAAAAIFTAILVGASVVAWQARVALAEKSTGGGSQRVHRLGVSRSRSDPGQREGPVCRGAAAAGRAQAARSRRCRSSNAGRACSRSRREPVRPAGERDSARVIEQALRLQASAAVSPTMASTLACI